MMSVEDGEWKPNMKRIKHIARGPAGPRIAPRGPERPRETELRPRRGRRGRRRGVKETAAAKSALKPAFLLALLGGGEMRAKMNTGEYESSALVETPVLFLIEGRSCARTP